MGAFDELQEMQEYSFYYAELIQTQLCLKTDLMD